MRQIAFIIVLALMLPSVGNLVILIGFLINQNYIARELCENKAKPGSKCNGKCHLKKKLNEANNQERKLPASLIFKEKTEFFKYEKHLACTVLFPIPSLRAYGFDVYNCARGFIRSFFHPPPHIC
jgi:hypothetical protein